VTHIIECLSSKSKALSSIPRVEEEEEEQEEEEEENKKKKTWELTVRGIRHIQNVVIL
jgi:hypothetical protein